MGSIQETYTAMCRNVVSFVHMVDENMAVSEISV